MRFTLVSSQMTSVTFKRLSACRKSFNIEQFICSGVNGLNIKSTCMHEHTCMTYIVTYLHYSHHSKSLGGPLGVAITVGCVFTFLFMQESLWTGHNGVFVGFSTTCMCATLCWVLPGCWHLWQQQGGIAIVREMIPLMGTNMLRSATCATLAVLPHRGQDWQKMKLTTMIIICSCAFNIINNALTI